MSGRSERERLRALSGVKWRRFDDDVIPAWVADMDFPAASCIIDAVRTMVDAGDFGYNMASFDGSVLAAWADWSERRLGWRPDAECSRVFSTSLQAVAAALATGTDPGDGVLIFSPVYAPFWGMIEGAGRRIVEYAFDRTEWRVDPDALRASIDEGTRAILLCNPHNPSGRCLTRDELAVILEVAQERDLLVVSDEIWQDFVYPGAVHTPFAALGPDALARSVVVTAASKSFSLGGLSCAVGFMGHERVRSGVAALPPHLLGGINALGARATLAAWTQGEAWFEQTLAQLRENRDHVAQRLERELPEVGFALPQATYLAWLDFRNTALAEDPAGYLLEHARVGLSPGPDFGASGAGFARLNFATDPQILDEILDRIVRAVREA